MKRPPSCLLQKGLRLPVDRQVLCLQCALRQDFLGFARGKPRSGGDMPTKLKTRPNQSRLGRAKTGKKVSAKRKIVKKKELKRVSKRITLADIFASKTQVKLIRFFLNNPRKEYYQTELCVRLKESLGSIQYELARLVRLGFLNIRRTKIKTYYSANPKFYLHNEFQAIVKKVK